MKRFARPLSRAACQRIHAAFGLRIQIYTPSGFRDSRCNDMGLFCMSVTQ